LPNGKRSIRLDLFQLAVRAAMARENIPLMPAAIELCAGYFLFKFFPALEIPMKDLELLNVVI
jgi:hypothetical protein